MKWFLTLFKKYAPVLLLAQDGDAITFHHSSYCRQYPQVIGHISFTRSLLFLHAPCRLRNLQSYALLIISVHSKKIIIPLKIVIRCIILARHFYVKFCSLLFSILRKCSAIFSFLWIILSKTWMQYGGGIIFKYSQKMVS